MFASLYVVLSPKVKQNLCLESGSRKLKILFALISIVFHLGFDIVAEAGSPRNVQAEDKGTTS